MSDGSVTINTNLNNDGFKSGLSKLGNIAKTGLKSMAIAAGTVTTAFAGIVTASVKARGDLEQQIGGTEAVFKEYAKKVQEYSKEAYSTMGLSANDYMATMNKMASLMQGSGIDIKSSMNLSSQAMQRAADVASIMGIDTASAMESIAGAAKGNFTMMDNLGVAMNATTIEAYALSKGINKSYASMTNAEKVQLAMEMFLEKSAYAMGNYAKENETFAGSLSTMKASIQNFLSGSGDIQDVIKSVLSFTEITMNSISEIIPEIIQSVAYALPQIIEAGTNILASLLQGIEENKEPIIESVFQILNKLINTVIENLPLIIQTGIEILVSLINGISESLPELIPIIIDAVILIVETLIDNIDLLIEAGIELIMGLADGLIEALPRLIEKAPVIIQKLIDAILNNLPKIVNMAGQLIGELVVALVQNLPKMWSAGGQIISSLIKGVIDLRHKMPQIGMDLIKGIWEGLGSMGEWLWSKVKGLFGGLTDRIKKFFGIHSPSTLFKDEIGTNLALGVGEGFTDNISSVYKDMKTAVDFQTQKMSANLSTTASFNKMLTATINVNGDVNMDSTKVGRMVAPAVTRTFRTGGAY